MKLIFEYNWGSEPCYGTTLFPVEYSSKDDLLLDFEIACIEAYQNSKNLDFFERQPLDLCDFMIRDYYSKKDNVHYHSPTVYTLEEWLERFTLAAKPNGYRVVDAGEVFPS
jgi:hypothetical protein